MLRCAFRRRAGLLACSIVLLIAASGPASAQVMVRRFPPVSLRGELVVTQPPQVRLNGQPAQLAPGARIHDEVNLIQLSGALIGRKLLVNYTTDLEGNPLEVWILRDDERAVVPWPRSRTEAQQWLLDQATQTWAKP